MRIRIALSNLSVVANAEQSLALDGRSENGAIVLAWNCNTFYSGTKCLRSTSFWFARDVEYFFQSADSYIHWGKHSLRFMSLIVNQLLFQVFAVCTNVSIYVFSSGIWSDLTVLDTCKGIFMSFELFYSSFLSLFRYSSMSNYFCI